MNLPHDFVNSSVQRLPVGKASAVDDFETLPQSTFSPFTGLSLELEGGW